MSQSDFSKLVDQNLTKALEKGDYEINGRDENWNNATPLMVNARTGTVYGLNLLLSKGASVNLKDDNEDTALHHAVINYDDPEKVKVLLDYGADKSIKNKDGKTALDIAIELGNRPKIVEVLKSYTPMPRVGGARRKKSKKSRKSKKSKKSKKSRKSRKSRK